MEMASDLTIPDTVALLREFAERHHLRFGQHIEHERLPVRASSLAQILVASLHFIRQARLNRGIHLEQESHLTAGR
jgi:hypothetical protein